MFLIQYWDTKELPDYIATRFESFRTHNPGLEHRIFDQASVEEFLETHFGPREVAAFRACAVPSMQSDYLRFCSVLTLGGIYCDADFLCVGPLTPLGSGVGGLEGVLFSMPDNVVQSNFFAFRSPGHPFLRLALEIATTNIERRNPEDDAWLTTGPGITTYMHYLFQAGSIEAFLEQFPGDEYVRDYPQRIAEVIGEHSRTVQAFNGVSVLPFEVTKAWIAGAKPPLPYKTTPIHWTNWEGSIFK